ncbi:MAG: hypothetical protein PHY47_11705 [Lachnospiraceae bacterium]|nr:hypothetical protein [Lachnospiraceae bacterium]
MFHRDKQRTVETYMGVVIVILFAISLYVVEWSSIGSHAVGQYNNGYGTFDMKSYSVDIVTQVLNQMEPRGFVVYKKYFVADFFFVLTFGSLQIMLLNMVYKWNKNKIKYILWTVPVLRGIFDIIENIMLLTVLNRFPIISERIIHISSIATGLKLLMIKIWTVIFIVGILWGIIKRREIIAKK